MACSARAAVTGSMHMMIAATVAGSRTAESAGDRLRVATYAVRVLVRALLMPVSGALLRCLGAAGAIVVSDGSLTTPVWSVTGVEAVHPAVAVAVLPPLFRLRRAVG